MSGPALAKRPVAERRTFVALLVSGAIIAFPGEILPAWGYHIAPSYSVVAHLFLSVAAGLLAGVAIARPTLAKWGVGPTLLLGCLAALCGLLGLAFAGPPVRWGWRLPGLAALGLAVSLVNTAFFQAVSPMFRRAPGRTVNLGGALFGAGSLLATLLTAIAFLGSSVRLLLLTAAMVPAVMAILSVRTRFSYEPPPPARRWRDVLADFTNPGAVLFSLLLFFQFGNEWTIASWLTLFLIQRLGISPTSALLILAVYWAALTGGRLLAHWGMSRVSHWKLLIASGAGALLGCFILVMTDNRFGAILGVLLTGLSFAAIYPVVVERIGIRFPYYHPGFFNGVFSFGLVGGLLAPAHAGYLAARFGLGAVMLLPALGTCMVLFLSLLMWAEAKFGPASAQAQHQRV